VTTIPCSNPSSWNDLGTCHIKHLLGDPSATVIFQSVLLLYCFPLLLNHFPIEATLANPVAQKSLSASPTPASETHPQSHVSVSINVTFTRRLPELPRKQMHVFNLLLDEAFLHVRHEQRQLHTIYMPLQLGHAHMPHDVDMQHRDVPQEEARYPHIAPCAADPL
jgi:hypothetical protein